MSDYKTINEYKEYIDGLNYDQLIDIKCHIDPDKYKDRYHVVIQAIENIGKLRYETEVKNKGTIYAGFWRRTASIFLELLVLGPIFILELWLDSLSRPVAIITAVLFPVIINSYQLYFDARWGQTIGKMLVNIKILKLNGENIGWNEAVLRNSINILFGILGVVGTLMSLYQISNSEYALLDLKSRSHQMAQISPVWFKSIAILTNLWMWSEVIVLLCNKKRRAIHDYIAGTVVVVKNS